jgi:phage-related minor tail protein
MLDMTAVAADLQDQLTALQRAVEAQQTTIDTLTDLVIDLLKAADARR